MNKLKANNNKPGRILALEEMDEIGNFEDYDTLPLYVEELAVIQNRAVRNSGELLLPQNNNNNKYLNHLAGWPESFYIGKASSESELNPFIKIATYMIESTVSISENITKSVVLDLSYSKLKSLNFKDIIYPFSVKGENAITEEDDANSAILKLCKFFKSNKKYINNKHLIIAQNDLLNVSHLEPEEIERYTLITEAIKRLKLN